MSRTIMPHCIKHLPVRHYSGALLYPNLLFFHTFDTAMGQGVVNRCHSCLAE